MRVLLGLAALAAGASAQLSVSVSQIMGGTTGTAATVNDGRSSYQVGPSLLAVTYGAPASATGGLPTGATYVNFGSSINGVNGVNSPAIGNTDRVQTQTFSANVPASVSTVYAILNYNSLIAEVQYYTQSSSSSAITYQCDPCTNVGTGSTQNCNKGATSGTGSNTNTCAGLTGRQFTLSGLIVGVNLLRVILIDSEAVGANGVTYSFSITRPATVVVGDPQIVGMQGQDFQVHGMPDEIFNMVTYPNVQVNARFTYLSEAECPDNYTTCFAHPGTYISEQGLRVGKDKVRVVAGPAKKGLSVHVNGKKVHQKVTHLKLGSVEIVNHRRVIVKTPIAALTMTNSDKFMNQEISMFDEKLLALGSKRHALKAGQAFHPEVPLHGLQGQTWRNVEYPSGLEYEGSIMDYHVVDGNLFGTDFVFNKYDL